LALLFLSPVLVAWIMHISGEGGWRPQGTTNHGLLIQPPRPLTLPHDLASRQGEPIGKDFLHGKWTLLYLARAECNASCRDSLYYMRQVRLAQGENLRRVQRLFLSGTPASPGELQAALQEYPDMTAAVLSREQLQGLEPRFAIDAVAPLDAARIYLVDPLGNLMMYYPADGDPRGMIKDLQRLLKYSRVG
jgi:cytochrome oxidase Cu insertion factor (SCO1/SenC/PrrC family)